MSNSFNDSPSNANEQLIRTIDRCDASSNNNNDNGNSNDNFARKYSRREGKEKEEGNFGRELNRRGGRDISAGKEVTPRELERSRDLFGERPAHYIVLSFKLYEYLLDRRWDHGRI